MIYWFIHSWFADGLINGCQLMEKGSDEAVSKASTALVNNISEDDNSAVTNEMCLAGTIVNFD